MSRVRRLTAAVLLILIVPSLAFAAMPLRYCLGSSGHQAIEFVIDGIAHGGSHASHEQALDDADECIAVDQSTVFADEAKCIDKSLMGVASSPPAIDLKQLLTAGFIVQAAVFPLPPPAPIVRAQSRFIERNHVVDPSIQARRTTVLLI